MNWNPNNIQYLYFHFTTKDGRDEYLKVDAINQKCYKVCLNSGSKRGRPYMRGLYELSWITFIGNYLHYGDVMSDKLLFKKHPHFKDWPKHFELKYTTKNQYNSALNLIFKQFGKNHERNNE